MFLYFSKAESRHRLSLRFLSDREGGLVLITHLVQKDLNAFLPFIHNICSFPDDYVGCDLVLLLNHH